MLYRDHRKILLGSDSKIAIALAGCTSVSSDQEAGTGGDGESNGLLSLRNYPVHRVVSRLFTAVIILFS